MSEYPINYDFGKNWKSKIVPFLDHPDIKKACREGIERSREIYHYNGSDACNPIPAYHSFNDGYSQFMERKRDILYKKLKRKGKIPQKLLNLEKKYKSYERDEEKSDDEICDAYCDFDLEKSYFLEKYFTWYNVRYDIESYCISGACHAWAPTFELTLAKLVEPNEEWRVLRNHMHSTVINKDDTKVFDLIYWAFINGRLETYVFGDKPYKKIKDKTLGGKKAFLKSIPELCSCKKCKKEHAKLYKKSKRKHNKK